MYIDTHCHLQFSDYDEDRALMIGNAKKAGVKKFIVPGVDEYSSGKAIELALSQPGIIFAAVGFHPYEASHNPDLNKLQTLLLSSPARAEDPEQKTGLRVKPGMTVVAIGECGLDYHLYKGQEAAGKKSAQKFLFSEQLHLALSHNLPVIMHCRDAYEDFFDVLDSLPSMPRGVIHCFSGGLQEMRIAKARGLFIGIDGNLTYQRQLQLITGEIPLEMILLETDAPYLTPIPYRGRRNEPKHIPIVAQKLAEVKKISISEIKKQTTSNAQNLFGI